MHCIELILNVQTIDCLIDCLIVVPLLIDCLIVVPLLIDSIEVTGLNLVTIAVLVTPAILRPTSSPFLAVVNDAYTVRQSVCSFYSYIIIFWISVTVHTLCYVYSLQLINTFVVGLFVC